MLRRYSAVATSTGPPQETNPAPPGPPTHPLASGQVVRSAQCGPLALIVEGTRRRRRASTTVRSGRSGQINSAGTNAQQGRPESGHLSGTRPRVQPRLDALGDAGADQVAGGGAAAIVEEAGRHAGRLTGGAPPQCGPLALIVEGTRRRRRASTTVRSGRSGQITSAGTNAQRGRPESGHLSGTGPRVQPRLARWPPRALTRWCVARGAGAARCAGRRCGPGGAARHAGSPERAVPDRRPAGRRSCALEFSWALDCERVLAGGVLDEEAG